MQEMMDWMRRRILAVALSAASFITLVSLIAPAWLDFLLDVSMVGLVALVGKLAKKEKPNDRRRNDRGFTGT